MFEFCDDPDCLWRLRLTRLSQPVCLPDGQVPAGAPVIELHLWNEHVPPIPPQGPNLAWAMRSACMLIESTHALGRHMRRDARLADVQAVGAVTMLIFPGDQSGGEKMISRLGFSLFPHRAALGRFGEFWENFYAWWLMWTYNAASLRRRQLWHLRRAEMWMSASEFLRRY